MKEINVYQTEDGEVFKTKQEAALHEKTLALRGEIKKYIASDFYPYKKALNTKYIVGKTIAGWERFKEVNK